MKMNPAKINFIVLAFAFATFQTVTHACEEHASAPSARMSVRTTKANTIPDITELSVPKISCMGCAYTIKKNLKPMTGVQDIKVDVDTKSVKFKCVNCDMKSVKSKLQEIGYPASEAS